MVNRPRARTRWTLRLCLPLTVLALVPLAAPASEHRFNPNSPSFATLFDAFNENYKQALYATAQGDRKRAASELMGTRLAWQMVVSRFRDTPPAQYRKDAKWRSDLTKISGYIQIADTRLDAGKLAEAHEALQSIRHVWAAVDARNGVRRFGDELVRFHDVMEPAVQAAAAGVNDSNSTAFTSRVDALAAGWQKVQDFGFSRKRPAEQKRLQEMMAAETQAIDNLRSATEAKDCPSITTLAPAVERAFEALYLEFG
jgi:hypothetical protein